MLETLIVPAECARNMSYRQKGNGHQLSHQGVDGLPSLIRSLQAHFVDASQHSLVPVKNAAFHLGCGEDFA
ncbi:hypothetical protein DPMN_154126 [Dreissena polymorpha]|uniref:Uncharacterized protein n=1 Tax=Dreissena polymorpha TaxID=45954 RepID=A0A9D4J9K6_DREPO|nr:hypothetical protein DPMN_154126 [Dreissena polymorpha]